MNENLTLLSTDSSDLLIALFVAVMANVIIMTITIIIIISCMHKCQEQRNAITLDNINRISGNIIVISVVLVIWELRYLIHLFCV